MALSQIPPFFGIFPIAAYSRNGELVIPYAVPDQGSKVASIPLEELFGALLSSRAAVR